MGILDEAIREHLELKRQRGATESELKRLEDEAFGPPSRRASPTSPSQGRRREQSGNGDAMSVSRAEAARPRPRLRRRHRRRGRAAEASRTSASTRASTRRPAAAEAPGPRSRRPARPSRRSTSRRSTSPPRRRRCTIDRRARIGARPPAPEALAAEPTERRAADRPIETLDTVEHAGPDRRDRGRGPASEPAEPERAPEPSRAASRGRARDPGARRCGARGRGGHEGHERGRGRRGAPMPTTTDSDEDVLAGHARVPQGRARGRRAVVRAGQAEGLRLLACCDAAAPCGRAAP